MARATRRENRRPPRGDKSPRSTDCGPADVKIENAEGTGNTLTAAVKDAHTNAKAVGQASCEGSCLGQPNGQLSCNYFETSWTVTSQTRTDNRWTVKGTSTGKCQCE